MTTPDTASIPFDAPQWRSRGNMKTTLGLEPSEIFVEADGRSDWWRTPPGSKYNVDWRTGPTMAFKVEGEEWSAGCWMRVGLKERFQQAALFVYAGPNVGDPNVSWLKAGVEFDGERESLSCVVTNPYSNSSTTPSPHSVSTASVPPAADANAGAPVWLYVQLTRSGTKMRCATALVRGVPGEAGTERPPAVLRPRPEDLVQAREVRDFALGAQDGPWAVGVTVYGPMSESTSARFANFSLNGATSVTTSV